MNNRNNRSQQNHFQQQSDRSQQGYRFQSSRKETLERDLRYLERDLIAVDVQIDALQTKSRALADAKNAHLAAIPFAIAQVALSTLGVRFLPPVARTWHYKHQQYLRAEEQLKQYALTLFTRRNVLTAQIEYLTMQLDMLQYQP